MSPGETTVSPRGSGPPPTGSLLPGCLSLMANWCCGKAGAAESPRLVGQGPGVWILLGPAVLCDLGLSHQPSLSLRPGREGIFAGAWFLVQGV